MLVTGIEVEGLEHEQLGIGFDTYSGRDRDSALLRATVLESLRLWPTTPAILRDTTAETHRESGHCRGGPQL